ncbi:DoxX family protein [Fredinandcohnia humi]
MFNKFEVSTVILRIVLGVSFFIHGLAKFQGGIENTVGWFESIGILGFLAYGVAILETVGGIALAVGLFSKVISGRLLREWVGCGIRARCSILGNCCVSLN